jgi:hypothetical protein
MSRMRAAAEKAATRRARWRRRGGTGERAPRRHRAGAGGMGNGRRRRRGRSGTGLDWTGLEHTDGTMPGPIRLLLWKKLFTA